MTFRRKRLLGFLVMVLAAGPALAQRPSPQPGQAQKPPLPAGVPTTAENVHLPTEGEVRLGRETAEEVEKAYKIVDRGPYHDRLQRVAAHVVAAIGEGAIIAEYRRAYDLPRGNDRSRRVPFEYSFKVLDTAREINAFSLAGGPIYVTRGLLDYAVTDDELAAVLAHECAHVAFHHVEQLIKKQRKLSTRQIWGLLAAVVAGVAGGGQVGAAATNVALGSTLIGVATLTGYGRELEDEADRIGLLAMSRTPYHPVGMLTFMRKLARDESRRGHPDFGIYQSHPHAFERVGSVRRTIEGMGVTIDPALERKVGGVFRASMHPSADGQTVELRLNGHPVFLMGDAAGEESVSERARRTVEALETLLLNGVTHSQVIQNPERSRLILRGVPILTVEPGDARAGELGRSTEALYREIIRLLWMEKLDAQ